mmetsp:Transcript_8467/g.25378  ORF Transcript_8467/g.25378 Transcript_8467/m.25378 type:complete len:184 (-) Transcript_8467:1172-1723(-)
MVKHLDQALKRRAAQGPDDVGHPSKRFYRSRAHSNPLNDSHFPVPTCPAEVDWSQLFPSRPHGEVCRAENYPDTATGGDAEVVSPEAPVRFVDVGCGFGGLLTRLAVLYPDRRMVGFELRDKVSEYVKERILALQRESPGQFMNIACARTNAMKFLPNYFQKGQLEKIFFLFPDPHFKATNHR